MRAHRIAALDWLTDKEGPWLLPFFVIPQSRDVFIPEILTICARKRMDISHSRSRSMSSV